MPKRNRNHNGLPPRNEFRPIYEQIQVGIPILGKPTYNKVGFFIPTDLNISSKRVIIGSGFTRFGYFYKHSALLGLCFGVSEFIFLRVRFV